MPLYDYRCKFCPEPWTIFKTINRLEINELCPKHHAVMQRCFTWNGQISMGSFKPGFQPAFGKYMKNKHELKDAMKRHEGETGKELHEIGNEKIRPVEPRKPDIKQAVQELKKKWLNN